MRGPPEQAFGSGEQGMHASWEEGESRHHMPPALPAEAACPLPRYATPGDGLHYLILHNKQYCAGYTVKCWRTMSAFN